jgi:hypothetical protein
MLECIAAGQVASTRQVAAIAALPIAITALPMR